MTMRTFTATALAVALTTGLGVAPAQDVGKLDVSPQEDSSIDTRVGNEPQSFTQGQTAQPTTNQFRPATQPRLQAHGAIQPGQATTRPAGQPAQYQPAGQRDAQSDRYEARRAIHAGATQQGVTIQEALVKKLIKANDAEIELAKLAQQKTNNDQVKQLTKTIIEDHQALNQSLQQVSKQQGAASNRSANNQPNANDRNSQDRQSGDRGANNWNTNQSNRPQLGQDRNRPMANQGQQAEMVPQELCDLGEQACDNALKMTKEMLREYDGQDFNMAFLGQQCVAHTMMLAELKAIQSDGPQELQSVAGKAIDKVEKHLETAKKIAKKLEKDAKDSRDS